jgi:hypothetical protein
LVYDLPLRFLSGNYGAQHASLKEKGVHNQGRCLLKGWELHDGDMAQVQASETKSIRLQNLPKRIAVLVCRKDHADQLEDREENYVWLPVVATTWWLDKAKCLEVNRRGFAVLPDFASTIHGATGRTLRAAITDLGASKDKPNPQAAMEGMIAVSRLKEHEDGVIPQPFSPGLFRQGPAAFPTLLLEVLKGEVKTEELEAKLVAAEDSVRATLSQKSEVLLKNMTHPCGTCGKVLGMNDFVALTVGMDPWYEAVEKDVFLRGVYAVCLACRNKSSGPERFRCAGACKTLKTAEHFLRSESSLRRKSSNVNREEIICLTCLYPACTNPACPRCPSCLEESCTSKGSCKKKPNMKKQSQFKAWREEEVDRKTYRCPSCSLRTCSTCEQEKCNSEFPARTTQGHCRNNRCMDCLHPA